MRHALGTSTPNLRDFSRMLPTDLLARSLVFPGRQARYRIRNMQRHVHQTRFRPTGEQTAWFTTNHPLPGMRVLSNPSTRRFHQLNAVNTSLNTASAARTGCSGVLHRKRTILRTSRHAKKSIIENASYESRLGERADSCRRQDGEFDGLLLRGEAFLERGRPAERLFGQAGEALGSFVVGGHACREVLPRLVKNREDLLRLASCPRTYVGKWCVDTRNCMRVNILSILIATSSFSGDQLCLERLCSVTPPGGDV